MINRSAVATHELSTAARIQRFAASLRAILRSESPTRGSLLSPSASAVWNRTRESGSSARVMTFSRKAGDPIQPSCGKLDCLGANLRHRCPIIRW